RRQRQQVEHGQELGEGVRVTAPHGESRGLLREYTDALPPQSISGWRRSTQQRWHALLPLDDERAPRSRCARACTQGSDVPCHAGNTTLLARCERACALAPSLPGGTRPPI